MKNYRYTLEKYRGIRSRYTCPQCGRKYVFTRYIDTETNQYIADDVGKCNRLDKCGYHYTPKQYFSDNKWRDSGDLVIITRKITKSPSPKPLSNSVQRAHKQFIAQYCLHRKRSDDNRNNRHQHGKSEDDICPSNLEVGEDILAGGVCKCAENDQSAHKKYALHTTEADLEWAVFIEEDSHKRDKRCQREQCSEPGSGVGEDPLRIGDRECRELDLVTIYADKDEWEDKRYRHKQCNDH